MQKVILAASALALFAIGLLASVSVLSFANNGGLGDGLASGPIIGGPPA